MSALITVELKSLSFFGFHGLYPEEQKTGNEFIVDLFVSHAPVSGTITDIHETVNYVQLYNLLKEEMKNSRPLLETFAMEIVDKIHLQFPHIKKVSITISKKKPPIIAFTGSVAVNYTKEY